MTFYIFLVIFRINEMRGKKAGNNEPKLINILPQLGHLFAAVALTEAL